METPIAHGLNRCAASRVAAGLLALLVVAADYGIVLGSYHDYLRPVLPLYLIIAYLIVDQGKARLRLAGIRLRPVQGLGYWLKATLVLGAIVGAVCLLVGGVALLVASGDDTSTWAESYMEPGLRLERLLYACVRAPLIEELPYRLGVCTFLVVAWGPRGAILVSGLAFGYLHVIYGNPGPDNLLAGYLLAWAFLRSGSLLVPLVLHSLGNFAALLLQVATWHAHAQGFI